MIRRCPSAAVPIVIAVWLNAQAWADPLPGLRLHFQFPHDHCPHDGYGFYPYDPYLSLPPAYAAPLPYYGYWSGAPLYLPAETIYGPEVVKRFMGVVPNAGIPRNIIVVPENNAGEPQAQAPLRGTNARSVALGRRFIEFGDAQFAQQKYASAYLRYKDAVKAAPQLAEAYFRQGFALVASDRYEWAARAFKRALELEPAWPASGFRIDRLYGNNPMAKQAHLDALAQAALDNPDDVDLLFLLGIMLHSDGQSERAEPFFQRARELAGLEVAHLEAFLP